MSRPSSTALPIAYVGLRILILQSQFNDAVVAGLSLGAVEYTAEVGASAEVQVVPGAFELPQVVRKVLARGGVDAVIALGAVIRGSTPHFDYVAGECAKGVSGAASTSSVPVVFGVLTTDTIEQALERAGTKAGNTGYAAAMAAIEMAQLWKTLGPG